MKPLILIAEDSPDILMLLLELLESEGYSVHSASDGQAAWDYLDNCIRCPDLLITDIMMPRLGGLELVQRIKNSESHKNMTIAIYSANFMYKQEAQRLACEFLEKPFDLTQVITMVERCTKGVHNE